MSGTVCVTGTQVVQHLRPAEMVRTCKEKVYRDKPYYKQCSILYIFGSDFSYAQVGKRSRRCIDLLSACGLVERRLLVVYAGSATEGATGRAALPSSLQLGGTPPLAGPSEWTRACAAFKDD